jgi:hypothetical protein
MPLDISKPVQTRDGRKVMGFIRFRRDGEQLVAGIVTNAEDDQVCAWWDLDGRNRCGFLSSIDLVNVPEPERTGWLIIWDGGQLSGCLYKTKEAALKCFRGMDIEACIEVKYRPGQGIE